MEWLAAAPPADYIHLSPHPFWNDPYHLVTRRISGNVSSLRIDVRGNKDAAWLAAWRTADQRAAATLMSRFRGEAIPNVTQKLVLDRSESEAFYHASKADVARWAFFFAASMPVREADWFLFPRACRGFYSNRGLSGIDGCIATAVGLAEGLASPVIAWVGDLAALHDLNALSLVRQSPHPICLIISNNGGGGIFSHLPVAADPLAEQWIAFEHQHSFQAAAALFDIPYRRTDDPTSLFAPLEEKTQLIEFVNHRSLNYEFHKALKTCFTGRV
jgi:2-succinyl-5-enolpyruvyl-6-hydroxy-3-cyclohexene-1-carboxylate synthase